MYKVTVLILVSFISVISLVGCAPSQAELLLEKQKNKKIRIAKENAIKEKKRIAKENAIKEKKRLEEEKRALEKKIRTEKYLEAQKYLKLQNDNSSVWVTIDKYKSKYNKTPYETSTEYKHRVDDLNNKIFNKKFLFDYTPKKIAYNPETKSLYVSFEVLYNSSNSIKLAKKNLNLVNFGTTQVYNKNAIVSDIKYGNTAHITKMNRYGNAIGEILVLVKNNCSAKEAKYIQNNWTVRFVTDILNDGKSKKVSFTTLYNIAKTDMIIVYNKGTDKIYKVLY